MKMKTLSMLLLLSVVLAGRASAGLIITFDSSGAGEGPPIPSIGGTLNDGTPINFIPTPICTALIGAPTQCTLSANIPFFPATVLHAGVNLLEPVGTEPNGGAAHMISDTLTFDLAQAGAVYALLIVYTTDMEGPLPAVPGTGLNPLFPGAGMVRETGVFQDVTNSFIDPTGTPVALPDILAPPTAANPHTFVPVQFLVRSDVPLPEPTTLLLLGPGLAALIARQRRRH